MKICVTGTAGFIGYHVTKCLLERGDEVVAVDSVNSYYDPALKWARLATLGILEQNVAHGLPVCSSTYPGLTFHRANLADTDIIRRLFDEEKFDVVCNLAAQAGVRHSLDHPMDYLDANIVGFLNILEGCRHSGVSHLVYASSSSVYGANVSLPFSVDHGVDHPSSLYAATKRSNELMAHAYSHLFDIPTTGLRFFTVYGPWGRPDMALFLFIKAALAGESIKVFNKGNMVRDFTYVDDVVEGLIRVIGAPPTRNSDNDMSSPGRGEAPFQVFNIGNSSPMPLMDYIGALEKHLGMTIKKEYLPMQSGDIQATHADVKHLQKAVGYSPSTPVDEGVRRFVEWYRHHYKV